MFGKSHLILSLSDTALRAARVSRDGSQIEQAEEFSLDETGLVGALEKVRVRFGQGARFVLPETYLYVTRLVLDVPAAHLRSVLEEKVADIFPEALGTIAWDYELIETTERGGVVELSGVVRDFGEVLKDALGKSRYRIQTLIPESYALARLLPVAEAALLVHESQDGWISALVMQERVITSLFLKQAPLEQDLRELIAFGTQRKGVRPSEVILSLRNTDPATLPTLDLPQRVLEIPLDPILGAARIVLRSGDSDRLDLPLRGVESSWWAKLSHLFKKV